MKTRHTEGYTIIEVMIFLAITGLLFASAVVAVGGGQRQAQYSQAVRDFESQIKDVANDVANGFYPTYTVGECLKTGSEDNPQLTLDPGGSSMQGANVDCINIGKTLMFNLASETFGVGTIVGLNPSITSSTDLSLSNLKPTLAYTEGEGTQIDLTTTKPIRFGAEVTKIGSDSFPDEQYSSISFLTDFNASGAFPRSDNGTLTTNVYGFIGNIEDNTSINQYKENIEVLENNSSVRVNPSQGFYVCLRTTDNRIARVIVGVDSVATATKSEFDLEGGPVCPV
jgi:type II secretory pathway pseudopilin PulG